MSVKRVIIFIPSIQTGGIEKNAIWLSNELVKRGIKVDIIYASISESQESKISNEVQMIHIPCVKIPFINPRLTETYFVTCGLKRYLKGIDKRGTVVIAFQSSSAAIGVCKKLNIKIICRLSSHPSIIQYEKDLTRKISQFIKPFTYRKADAVIGNSLVLSQDYAKLFKRDVVTIYNPIEFDRIQNTEELLEPQLLEDIQNYPGRIIITVGRLAAQKDYFTMLKGYQNSVWRDKSKLWIVGDGSERKNIEAAIKELGLNEQVRLLGFKKNVYQYLNSADLYIQTSLHEGCPNALIEAVAAGLPAIATDCLSGPAEVLLNGEGGELIPIGDSLLLARKIDDFFENPEQLKKKLKVAQEELYKYDSRNVIQQYLDLINEILGEK